MSSKSYSVCLTDKEWSFIIEELEQRWQNDWDSNYRDAKLDNSRDPTDEQIKDFEYYQSIKDMNESIPNKIIKKDKSNNSQIKKLKEEIKNLKMLTVMNDKPYTEIKKLKTENESYKKQIDQQLQELQDIKNKIKAIIG